MVILTAQPYPSLDTTAGDPSPALHSILFIFIPKPTYIVPPRSCALSVTTAAPNHTTKKTAANTSAPWSSGAVMLSRLCHVCGCGVDNVVCCWMSG